ncbi:MAG TPA: nuclear transport factor 2 family protein [Candidatus Acidoferrales bacterium]|nr:nuclear transport factor 2 family protein [Candidatus Acidoferrales bacterium]
MSKESAALVKAMYDGFSTGNVPGVLGSMSPSIAWNEAENFIYADGNPYVGPEAVLEGVFMRCIGEWHGFTVAIDEILDAGDTVVALGHYLGENKETGKPVCAQLAHVWRVKDGRAVGFQQYVDTLQVARAYGTA